MNITILTFESSAANTTARVALYALKRDINIPKMRAIPTVLSHLQRINCCLCGHAIESPTRGCKTCNVINPSAALLYGRIFPRVDL